MTKSTFIYVTYIATRPEKVWQALTDAELSHQYWNHEKVSDWQPGSPWEMRANADGAVKIVGEVLECDEPKKLVISWAAPADRDLRERHSRVTYEIEPMAEMVRLTVTHDELDEGSDMARDIAGGWPLVLSSMKSFLETGKPLRF